MNQTKIVKNKKDKEIKKETAKKVKSREKWIEREQRKIEKAIAHDNGFLV